MYQVIIVFHVLLGLGIIGLVLMQQGKGADAGAAFGSGASGSVFGAQGAASFLSRSTAILATLFFLTSLGLAVLNSHKGVAYDLMSEPATSEEASTLPVVEEPKKEENKPAVKSEEVPAAATEAKPVSAEKVAAGEPKAEAAAVPEVEEKKAEETKKTEAADTAPAKEKKETPKK
ncbi:preprotein translocase subunit SecG [Methylosarcina fibrata]|uniref:preprotein translocase subunit SecG n=1 Tax=Methylosarcina fibrata TaxID=105972 RepID=UPI00036B009B|nr:preprotein translocase subunit SecG [Methylosarcina fibrata]